MPHAVYDEVQESSDVDHLLIQNIGTNSHAQIDSHITNTSNPHSVIASQVEQSQLDSPTYTTVQDWINNTQGSGIISWSGFTDNADGSVTVEVGTGFIKTTISAIGSTIFFDWAQDVSVSLTDNSNNYVMMDYNGGSPQVTVAVTDTSNGQTIVLLGEIFREGTSLHFTENGLKVTEFAQQVQRRLRETQENVRASGSTVSETGTINIRVEAGVWYSCLTRIITPLLDTSVTGTFEHYYYNGSAWVESDETQIDNTNYNDTSSGLVALTANRYGVHWVYQSIDNNGEILVVYGQGDYTANQAEAADPPATLPAHITANSSLIAKIIIKKSAVVFTTIEQVGDVFFVSGAVSDHNSTTGLQGGTAGEYYHLTSAQHVSLTGSALLADISNTLASDTTFNLTSTGDFIISDDGTPFVTFKDNKQIEIDFGTLTTEPKLHIKSNLADTGDNEPLITFENENASGDLAIDLKAGAVNAHYTMWIDESAKDFLILDQIANKTFLQYKQSDDLFILGASEGDISMGTIGQSAVTVMFPGTTLKWDIGKTTNVVRELWCETGDFTAGGIRLQVDITDISNPPTDAEIDAIFGTPGSVGEGFMAIIDDNNAGANVYLAVSAGEQWWHQALTLAA